MSSYAESLAGLRAAPALEDRLGGTVVDPVAQGRMKAAGDRLAEAVPELSRPWHFHLLASDKINAFSLPGGLIYLTDGLYRRIGENDDLLAAVIAHEMGHVVHKDSLKPRCRNVAESLDREISADGAAVRYLRLARYPTECLTNVLWLIRDAQPTGWAQIRMERLADKQGEPVESAEVIVASH